MNNVFRQRIKDSGLKIKYLAEKVDMSPSHLSMAIKGERFLSPEKERIIREILDRVPA